MTMKIELKSLRWRTMKLLNRLCSNDSGRFKLAKSTWSLNELKFTTTHYNDVINDKDIEHLAKLSKINLNYVNISKNDIVNDVNVILKCAKIITEFEIKDNEDNISFHNILVYPDDIRDDIPDKSSVANRELLLNNAPHVIRNHFAVPLVIDDKS